jgi:hypothetical protein
MAMSETAGALIGERLIEASLDGPEKRDPRLNLFIRIASIRCNPSDGKGIGKT